MKIECSVPDSTPSCLSAIDPSGEKKKNSKS